MAKYKGEDIDTKPTEAIAKNAERGLDWREEYGRGGTAVGVARARDLFNRTNLSFSTIRRMRSYFARHAVDAEAEGFNSVEEGFPSAGRIAWELWGGNAGESWAKRITKKLDSIDEEKKGKSMDMKIEHRAMGVDASPINEDERRVRILSVVKNPSPDLLEWKF